MFLLITRFSSRKWQKSFQNKVAPKFGSVLKSCWARADAFHFVSVKFNHLQNRKMSFSKNAIWIATLFLFTGSVNTLAAKWANLLKVSLFFVVCLGWNFIFVVCLGWNFIFAAFWFKTEVDADFVFRSHRPTEVTGSRELSSTHLFSHGACSSANRCASSRSMPSSGQSRKKRIPKKQFPSLRGRNHLIG